MALLHDIMDRFETEVGESSKIFFEHRYPTRVSSTEFGGKCCLERQAPIGLGPIFFRCGGKLFSAFALLTVVDKDGANVSLFAI